MIITYNEPSVAEHHLLNFLLLIFTVALFVVVAVAALASGSSSTAMLLTVRAAPRLVAMGSGVALPDLLRERHDGHHAGLNDHECVGHHNAEAVDVGLGGKYPLSRDLGRAVAVGADIIAHAGGHVRGQTQIQQLPDLLRVGEAHVLGLEVVVRDA